MLIIGLIMIILASAISSRNWKWKIEIVTGRFSVNLINWITMLVLIYAGLLSYHLSYQDLISSGIGVYNGLFQITYITQIFDMFLFIIGGILLQLTSFQVYYEKNNLNINTQTSIESLQNKDKDQNQDLEDQIRDNNNQISDNKKEISEFLSTNLPEYPIICIFSVIGSSFLISSYDLVSMYLSIELQSYGLYILSSLNRDSQESTSAGLKYFLLGSLASGLILLGSSLIYGLTGVTNFESISIFLEIQSFDFSLELAIIIILIGFSFKIASAPFHHWAPDVYDGVATIVTTWIVIIPKISILIFLFHFINISHFLDLNLIHDEFINKHLYYLTKSNYLLIASFLSLLIGTIQGLTQTRIKRLLAYSSISNIGFLLLALAIQTSDSLEAFLFYLISYTITNINIFFILLAFGYLIRSSNINLRQNMIYSEILENNSSPIKYISQLKGEMSLNPLLSLSLAISLFSFAGIPPLIGFFAKQMVLLSAAENGFYFLAIVGIISSIISAAYYLKIIKVVYFDVDSSSDSHVNIGHSEKFNNHHSDNNFAGLNENVNEKLSVNHYDKEKILASSLALTISIITLIIILFLVKPNILLNSAHFMALSFYLK